MYIYLIQFSTRTVDNLNSSILIIFLCLGDLFFPRYLVKKVEPDLNCFLCKYSWFDIFIFIWI